MKKSRLTQRISSVVLVIVMFVTMFTTMGVTNVSAAFNKTTVYNWHIHNASNPDGAVKRDVEVKHNGDASLNVSLNSGSFYLSNPIATLSMEQNTKYRLEYYAKVTLKGSADNAHNVVWDSIDGNKQARLFGTTVTKEEEIIDGEPTGWTKYYKDITTGSNPVIYFMFTGAMNINFDDIKLYKYTDNVLGTENLIEDGDFEATAAISHGSNDEIEGYTVSHTYAGKYVPEKLYATTNADRANVRTGNGSLRLVRSGYANKFPSPTIKLTSNFSPVAGNSYKLVYYVKDDGDTSYTNGSITANNTNAGIAWTLGGITKNASNATVFTRTEEADAAYPGWDKLEATFDNVTNTTALQVTFMAHFDGYIDDISVYKLDGNGEVTGSNLLEYGSFNFYVPDPMDYEPKNVLMISGHKDGGVINTSWRNPEKMSLNKVTLIDITDAENPVVLSENLNTTPGDTVEYYTSGLNATTVYTYKLKFDFSDGESREIIMSQKPFVYDAQNTMRTGKQPRLLETTGSWRFGYGFASDGTNPYILPTNITVDENETYGDSKGSLHIQSNKDAEAARPTLSNGNWDKGYFIRLDNDKDAKSSVLKHAKYRVKFMMKTNNMKDTGAASRIFLGGADGYFKNPTLSASDGKWTEYSIERDLSSITNLAGGLRVWFPSDDVEDMWIDNIEIWELDAQGNEVTNLLASTGGFETWTAATAVSEAGATPANKSITINYTAPTDSRYVRIYERGNFEGEEQWKLRAICEPSTTTVTLQGLSNGTDYTYKIVSQSTIGVYSEGVTVSATPVAPPYEVESDFMFKLGSENVDAISGNGTYNVSLDLTNYSVLNFAPALIIALYKDDILVDFNKSDNKISADEMKKTLTANVTISNYDENAKYEISAFFWDGFDSMNPIMRSVSWYNR